MTLPGLREDGMTEHTCPVCSCPVALYVNPMVATEPEKCEPESLTRWAEFLIERCPMRANHPAAALDETHRRPEEDRT